MNGETEIQREVHNSDDIIENRAASCLQSPMNNGEANKIFQHFKDYEISDTLFNIVKCIAGEIENCSELDEILINKNNLNLKNKHGESGLHLASGLGQLKSLELLLRKGANIDQTDENGDAALHWAARHGQSEAVATLIRNGAQINLQNKDGESCLHLACRFGHIEVVQSLVLCNMNIDLQDKEGFTGLHVAAWNNYSKIASLLCSASANVELSDKNNETALHKACCLGYTECVRVLLNSGCRLDAQNTDKSSPLILAVKNKHVNVSLLLLHAGANTDLVDKEGNSAIHLTSQVGLLSVAQTLCAFGCKVDEVNQAGLYPVHIAARNGHTEIVRCLCLAGCRVNQKSGDGILAEVCAMAHGFDDITDLLHRLRNEQERENYIEQLIPSTYSLPRLKIQLIGHSEAGKSTLVETLKAGYFSSLFRRSKSLASTSNIQQNTASLSAFASSQNPTKNRTNSLKFKLLPPVLEKRNSLDLLTGDNYTKGIEVQQININGIGDVSIWDFSAHENYLCVYDHFLSFGSSSIVCVLFDVRSPFYVQLKQTSFWLSFVQARLPLAEPLGFRGMPHNSCRILLIATHADEAQLNRNSQGEFVCPQMNLLQEKLNSSFGDTLNIHDTIWVLDAHAAGSAPIKSLKSCLNNAKINLSHDMRGVTSFLMALETVLPEWRIAMSDFPALTWREFVEAARDRVNCLAGEDHLREVLGQLQTMGDITQVTNHDHEYIVIDPHWLTSKQIGMLLSKEYSKLAKITGCYTIDDFQMSFPDCDALDLLQILEGLNICTQCDNDGETEFEFPIFNKIETLEGLWSKFDERYRNGVYAGVRLKTPAPTQHILPPTFTRIQVQLRRSWQGHTENEADLYQWLEGSKFCSGSLESLITLEGDGEAIEIKVRGPENSNSKVFYFIENVLAVIRQVLSEMCPGMLLEKHLMSAIQLKRHSQTTYAWPPGSVFSALLACADFKKCLLVNPILPDVKESFASLVCFPDSENETKNFEVGGKINACRIPPVAIQKLSSLLDPSHPTGSDWCVLGVKLNLDHLVPSLDRKNSIVFDGEFSVPRESPTAIILNSWCKNNDSSIGRLIEVLHEMGREDAVVVLLNFSPFFVINSTLNIYD